MSANVANLAETDPHEPFAVPSAGICLHQYLCAAPARSAGRPGAREVRCRRTWFVDAVPTVAPDASWLARRRRANAA